MGDVIGIIDHLCKAESRAEAGAVVVMAMRIAGEIRPGDDASLFVYALMKVALACQEIDQSTDDWIEFVQDALLETINQHEVLR